MTNKLIIGDYAYSSWSLRGWLLFRRFGIPAEVTLLDFFADESVAEQVKAYAPAKTVPIWVTEDGDVLGESIAIAEELATRYPAANLWPADPAARAVARALTAEMHSGFGTLRNDCPMNIRVAYSESPVSDDLKADLARIDLIFGMAREKFGRNGPWLCGEYSIADAFYAPVAARIAGYSLPVSQVTQDYVNAHLNDGAFRRWRAMGLIKGADLPWYARDYPQKPWPGPTPLAAKAVDSGTPENDACPYSGLPVTHLLELDGRIFGFCNDFCRDKTVADPEAWPQFMALL
ncbi:MAG: glutathione S-transferase [Thalassococcus sp.]|uniref:glutathione S-transferase n=1 Tax=Thalassococcus sp. TaxID=1928858 RepID=UPI001B0BD4C0|nr:glutathione S-transferase [Thalassococcus sp.]MBO6865575.1 glutathione S-transferase [Thalassococcus sp.]